MLMIYSYLFDQHTWFNNCSQLTNHHHHHQSTTPLYLLNWIIGSKKRRECTPIHNTLSIRPKNLSRECPTFRLKHLSKVVKLRLHNIRKETCIVCVFDCVILPKETVCRLISVWIKSGQLAYCLGHEMTKML